MNIERNGFITLSNQQAECTISLWGGNIVSYRQKSEQHDIFWLGDLNKFDNIQAIRGGIPVCWPRFAEEELNSHLPRHGFARLSNWTVDNIVVDDTKIEVKLSLIPETKYNLNLIAKLHIKITNKLEYSLETINNSSNEFKFSEALHAYFKVGSKDAIKIKGVANHQYKNSLNGKIYTQEKDLTINDEFDASFLNHTSNIEIIDTELNRVISIEKTGSNTTVIWNPNKDLAEMSKEQYKHFICVEPANQGDYFVTLPPQTKHKISMIISSNKITNE